MESFKNYRDNLAKKLTDIRSIGDHGKEAAKVILQGEQSTEQYQQAQELHNDVRDLEKAPNNIDKTITDLESQIAELKKQKESAIDSLSKKQTEYGVQSGSVETSSPLSEQFQQQLTDLSLDIKSAWNFSAEMSPILKNPTTLDWNEFIKKSTEQSMTPGEFTLNPETLNLDFDTITPVVINKPEWQGKKLGEIMAEVIRDYSATHYIPGYDYIEWLNKNPDKHYDILDKTNYFYAPATVIGNDSGSVRVPCTRWGVGRWDRGGRSVGGGWMISRDRVLLLPR
jgi:seryl-tRNA synthetase